MFVPQYCRSEPLRYLQSALYACDDNYHAQALKVKNVCAGGPFPVAAVETGIALSSNVYADTSLLEASTSILRIGSVAARRSRPNSEVISRSSFRNVESG